MPHPDFWVNEPEESWPANNELRRSDNILDEEEVELVVEPEDSWPANNELRSSDDILDEEEVELVAEPEDPWPDDNELESSDDIWDAGEVEGDIAGCASSGFVIVRVVTSNGSSCGFLVAEPEASWADNKELESADGIWDDEEVELVVWDDVEVELLDEPEASWADNKELESADDIWDAGEVEGDIGDCATSGFVSVRVVTSNGSSGGFLDATLGSELSISDGGVFPATMDIFEPPKKTSRSNFVTDGASDVPHGGH